MSEKKEIVTVEKDCSSCLWFKEIARAYAWFACAHPKYGNLHLKKNNNGEWVKHFNNKYYKIGICKGHTPNTDTNKLKLINLIIGGD